ARFPYPALVCSTATPSLRRREAGASPHRIRQRTAVSHFRRAAKCHWLRQTAEQPRSSLAALLSSSNSSFRAAASLLAAVQSRLPFHTKSQLRRTPNLP